MVRGKKIFTVGSIISMALMVISLMFGFAEDIYRYRAGSYSYYYGYSSGYSYYVSFADYYGEWYWPLFATVVVYVVFGILAMALYNKRVKAICVLSFIWTIIAYSLATIVAIIALGYGSDAFGSLLLSAAVGVAFPFHFAVGIVSLSAKKVEKPVYEQPVPMYAVPQPPVYAVPQAPVYAVPQAPVYVAPPVAPAPTMPNDNYPIG